MTLEELFAKALHNQAFWSELKSDPARALKEAGIKPTPKQVETLKALDFGALERVATAFGQNTIT